MSTARPEQEGSEIGLHGVFLALRVPPPGSLPRGVPAAPAVSSLSVGVLILGPPGIGKGELALELISRGHALVADDAPRFHPTPEGRWLGRCPPPLQGFLEVRGPGILNIQKLFGGQAVCAEHPLDLVICLEAASSGPQDRLAGAWRDYRLGDARIPALPLQAGGRRNLALLVETAARLRAYGAAEGVGYNAAVELSRRLETHLGKESL